MRLLKLLEQRNHYLEKFVTVNEQEIARFLEDNFDGLDEFYNLRENILEAIRYIDSQINIEEPLIDISTVTAQDREKIKNYLQVKNTYLNMIIQQDVEILACIDAAKSVMIRELQEIKKGKKAVSGYKSPQFTNRLDEEA